MSRKGWTEVIPCAGCKKVVGRPKDGVCRECASLMKDGERFRENAERMKSQEDMIRVCIPDSWEHARFDWLISGAYNYSDDETLGMTFAMLARELIQQSEEDNYNTKRGFVLFKRRKKRLQQSLLDSKPKYYYYGDSEYEFAQAGYMPKRVAGLLHKLWLRVNKSIIEREKHAYEYGGNIIKQIAVGDATVNDFEGQTKRKK